MKIVVYTIAKDESKNVEAYCDNVKDADLVIVGVDVRSTDDTAFKLKQRGVKVVPINVKPWRFDTARNIVLQEIPLDTDICISLDLDERLSDGWRKAVESEWEKELTLLNYPYIYLWADEAQTIPSLSSPGYKIHARDAYVWQNAVHENFKPLKTEVKKFTNKLKVEHHPDLKKERNYNAILDRVVKEEPNNAWMRHVRARELFIHNRTEECIEECKAYLELTKAYDDVEIGQCRAEMCRLIARSLYILQKAPPGELQMWMLRGAAEAPNQRESWVYLGESWLMSGNLPSAYGAFVNALSINDRLSSPECEERCWDDHYLINLINEIKPKL